MKLATSSTLLIGTLFVSSVHGADMLDGITLQQALKNTGQSEPGNVLNGSYNSPTVDLYTTSEASVVSVFYDVETARNKWRFGFKVPAQKGEDTTLASLDGLAKYNTVTVGYQWSFFPSVSVTSNHNDCIDLKNKLENKLGDDSHAYGAPCSVSQLRSEHGDSQYSNVLSDMFAKRWSGGIWNFGLDAELGSKSFSYIPDLTTNSKISEDKEAWALKANVGWFNAIDTAVSLEYRRESKYIDADSVTFCTALSTPCVTGALGAPVKKESDIVTLQYRRVFDQEKNRAFTIKVEHDFDDDNTKVEVPVFLFSSKTEGYSGGLAFGWNESDPGLKVGIFVGKSFEL